MKNFVLILMMGFVVSCAQKEVGDTLVTFMEQETGVEPYQTRMIVTKDFVRVDDGDGSNSFILYDRNKKIVYSINPEEQSVMAVHEKKLSKGEVFEPPFKLTHASNKMPELKDAPMISGEKAKHYQLITNDEICYDVVAVKGLMPNVVQALSDFHLHMASDSRVTFNNIPADMQDACEMTMTTFQPIRQFAFGFPIQEWGSNGYTRSLIDYKTDYKVDPNLFVFPEGYKHYTVQDLREGKVKFGD